jgi:hypothetical protein
MPAPVSGIRCCRWAWAGTVIGVLAGAYLTMTVMAMRSIACLRLSR